MAKRKWDIFFSLSTYQATFVMNMMNFLYYCRQ